ncbi:MAG TPA: polysaccharide deacetylase family protein, partial [Thermoanaerobaculia bacterium]|nr:polysaccharide deacetylase family protein [Thermoanaerobaculia bacterium]
MKTVRIDVEEVAYRFGEELAAAIVDFPKSGQALEGSSLEVVGWAVGRSSRVTHVELVLEGSPIARAAMRADREDVARVHAGFAQGSEVSFLVATPSLPPGKHRLSLRAVLAEGPAVELAELRVTAVPRDPAVGLVLLYHRIVELRSEPWSLSVAPRRFDEQMKALRAIASPVALARIAGALGGGEIPQRAVAVTFDDGYADNHAAALPVLERHGVPATVFVTTGFVGQPLEMWWDQLERILLVPGTLPRSVRFIANGRLREWDLGDDAVYSEARAASHEAWRAGAPAPTLRHSAYREIWDLL